MLVPMEANNRDCCMSPRRAGNGIIPAGNFVRGEGLAIPGLLKTPIGRQVVTSTLILLVVAGWFAYVLQVSPEARTVGWLFWVPVFVGLGGWLISGWVWALRPKQLATQLFFLSGICTAMFSLSVAPHAMLNFSASEELNLWIGIANFVGAACFGAVFIVLFMVYPVRLRRWPLWAGLSTLLFLGWTGLFLFGIAPPQTGNWITPAEMLGIIAMVGVQYIASRNDPRARAILIWFGGAAILGPGAFIICFTIPEVFHLPVLIPIRIAFGFFLLMYVGVAAGLRRFRLFDSAEWAFKALFFGAGAVLLLVVDAVLIWLLPIAKAPAFGLSLLLIALIYLPLRDRMARFLFPAPDLDDAQVLRDVISVAFEPTSEKRVERWDGLMQFLFKPLEISVAETSSTKAEIGMEGLQMRVPAIGDIPPLALGYPEHGRGLFGPRHMQLANQLVSLMQHADEGRAGYARGVLEERGRIARDIHDNIGAHLLGALHAGGQARKDDLIRETLTDLREVINNAEAQGLQAETMLADLRVESADRLEAAGVKLHWHDDFDHWAVLSSAQTHALRSMLREAISNTIKHANARNMDVAFLAQGSAVAIDVRDDGIGFDANTQREGNGLLNMTSRLEREGGSLQFIPAANGSHMRGTLPLRQEGGT